MQKFEYRYPRIYVDCAVIFTTQENTITGRCTNISTVGAGASLSQPVPIGTTGLLTIESLTCALEVHARVTHSGLSGTGLAFTFSCNDERAALEQFLEKLPKLHRL